jgi:hypothetical protein
VEEGSAACAAAADFKRDTVMSSSETQRPVVVFVVDKYVIIRNTSVLVD